MERLERIKVWAGTRPSFALSLLAGVLLYTGAALKDLRYVPQAHASAETTFVTPAPEFIADTQVVPFRGTQVEVFSGWRPIIPDSVVSGGLSTDRERFPQIEARLFGTLINGTIRGAKLDLTLEKWANARSALEKMTGFIGFIDLASLNERELAPEKVIFEGQEFKTLTGVAWKGRTTDGRLVRIVKVDAPDNFRFPMILTRDKTIANRDGFRRGETDKNLQGLLTDRGEFLFFAEIFTPDGQLQHQIMVRSACGNAGGRRLEVIVLETATPAPTPTAGPEVPEVAPAPTETPITAQTPIATATPGVAPTETPIVAQTPIATATPLAAPTETPMAAQTPIATATPAVETPIPPSSMSTQMMWKMLKAQGRV